MTITTSRDLLPLMARRYSASFDIKVEIKGKYAFSTRDTITLPDLDISDPRLETMMLGYLVHESSHIRFSDFDCLRTVHSDILYYLINTLEDSRVEKCAIDIYPGVSHNLMVMNQNIYISHLSTIKRVHQLSKIDILLLYLLFSGQDLLPHYPFSLAMSQVYENELQNLVDASGLQEIKDKLQLLCTCESTSDVYALSNKILEVIRQDGFFVPNFERFAIAYNTTSSFDLNNCARLAAMYGQQFHPPVLTPTRFKSHVQDLDTMLASMGTSYTSNDLLERYITSKLPAEPTTRTEPSAITAPAPTLVSATAAATTAATATATTTTASPISSEEYFKRFCEASSIYPYYRYKKVPIDIARELPYPQKMTVLEHNFSLMKMCDFFESLTYIPVGRIVSTKDAAQVLTAIGLMQITLQNYLLELASNKDSHTATTKMLSEPVISYIYTLLQQRIVLLCQQLSTVPLSSQDSDITASAAAAANAAKAATTAATKTLGADPEMQALRADPMMASSLDKACQEALMLIRKAMNLDSLNHNMSLKAAIENPMIIPQSDLNTGLAFPVFQYHHNQQEVDALLLENNIAPLGVTQFIAKQRQGLKQLRQKADFFRRKAILEEQGLYNHKNLDPLLLLDPRFYCRDSKGHVLYTDMALNICSRNISASRHGTTADSQGLHTNYNELQDLIGRSSFIYKDKLLASLALEQENQQQLRLWEKRNAEKIRLGFNHVENKPQDVRKELRYQYYKSRLSCELIEENVRDPRRECTYADALREFWQHKSLNFSQVPESNYTFTTKANTTTTQPHGPSKTKVKDKAKAQYQAQASMITAAQAAIAAIPVKIAPFTSNSQKDQGQGQDHGQDHTQPNASVDADAAAAAAAAAPATSAYPYGSFRNRLVFDNKTSWRDDIRSSLAQAKQAVIEASELQAYNKQAVDDASATAFVREVSASAAALRHILKHKLQSYIDILSIGGASHGRHIDINKAVMLPLGEERIFKKYDRVLDYATAVHLLVDISGSMSKPCFNTKEQLQAMELREGCAIPPRMRTRCYQACKTALTMSLSLAPIPGIYTMATYFPGPLGSPFCNVLKAEENVNRAPERFWFYPEGGTPMAEAIWFAIDSFTPLSHCERKIIVIITDGMPDSIERTREAIEFAQEEGIEIYTIGINVYECADIFPYFENLEDSFVLVDVVGKLLLDLFSVQRKRPHPRNHIHSYDHRHSLSPNHNLDHSSFNNNHHDSFSGNNSYHSHDGTATPAKTVPTPPVEDLGVACSTQGLVY